MNIGGYLESRNGKYRLASQSSELVLNCGFTIFWRSALFNNGSLFFDVDGLNLVLRKKTVHSEQMLDKPLTIWKAGTDGRANKLVLQDNGNLVLKNDCNKTIWETKTADACPPGLK